MLRLFAYLFLSQVSAAIFGILMLALIVLTFVFYPVQTTLPRYDFIFIIALVIQIGLIFFKWETLQEAKLILVFHIVGTIMEIFKTYAGSWIYPEENFIRLAGVPLFSGFMYAAVGSYIARCWRIYNFRFEQYPAFATTVILSIAIYINFFTHHYFVDMRWLLFLAIIFVFWRTYICVCLGGIASVRFKLLWLFVAIAGLIYIAENIGTYCRAWIYPIQSAGWQWVPLTKFGSWFLLMMISWVLVSALYRGKFGFTGKVRIF